MGWKVSPTKNLTTLLAINLQKIATHFQKVADFVQLWWLVLSRVKRAQVFLAQIHNVESHRIFKYQPAGCAFILLVEERLAIPRGWRVAEHLGHDDLSPAMFVLTPILRRRLTDLTEHELVDLGQSTFLVAGFFCCSNHLTLIFIDKAQFKF